MFGLGAPELIIILVILMLLFGGAKLPQLSRAIGQSLREIRRGAEADLSEPTQPKSSPDAPQKPPAPSEETPPIF